MSFLVKSLTGVVLGIATLAGAVWVSLPNSQNKVAEPKEALALRKDERISSLTSIFSNADRSKRLKIVQTIKRGGENLLTTIFAFNEDTKRFYDEGLVETQIDAWCQASYISEFSEVLNKQEICKD